MPKDASRRPTATSDASSDRLIERAVEAGVHYIDLQFTDVMGAVKTVTIPTSQLGACIEHGTWFDGSSVESLARTAESDMYLVPDPTTFQVLPWSEPRTARLICWARTPDGEAYPGDPRGALLAAVDRAAALGFDYRVGPELEFFLLERDASGVVRPLPGDRGGYFDFATDRSVAIRQQMVGALQGMGIEVNSIHHEIAAGQHEVDFSPSGALTAADDVVTFRYVLKAVAQQAGVVASFMPKPFHGQSGSGMHVHQSLGRGDSENAFSDGDDEYGLSELARHFIAGQLHHAAGMCAVLSPLVNSYKRLVRGFEAPIFVSWARTNRGALIRVPHVGRAAATRVELRSPDPSCNPYLAFAVMLRCGLDGIERRLAVPAPVEESLYEFDDEELERRNVGVLPTNLRDALDAFSADDVVRDALGDHLADRFVEAKLLEWKDYGGQVTPWEIDRYLERA